MTFTYGFSSAVLALSLFGISGCTRYDTETLPVGKNRLSLTFTRSDSEGGLTAERSEQVFANLRFVASHRGSGGTFSHEVILTKDQNTGSTVTYSGMMRQGDDWDLAVVSSEAFLTLPGEGAPMATTAMYTMAEDAETCPELFFNNVALPRIVADQDARVETTLARNVSQVYVRIADKHGIVKEKTEATVELLGVPSTVSWTGAILPNKINPAVRKKPIILTIPENEEWTTHDDGYRLSSEGHSTIIPAHRGSDFWSSDGRTPNSDPTDVMEEYKMQIKLTYTDRFGEKRTTCKTVPKMPLCNGRIIYNLIPIPVNADVEIETELLPWNVEDTQTEIVDRPLKAENCVVMAPGGVVRIPLMEVYQAWNHSASDKLDPDGSHKMDQKAGIVLDVLATEGLSRLLDAKVIDPLGSGLGPHKYIEVTAREVGDGVLTMRLEDDPEGTCRWSWQVNIIRDPQAGESCPADPGSDLLPEWGTIEADKEEILLGYNKHGGGSCTIYPVLPSVTLTTGPGAYPWKLTLVGPDKKQVVSETFFCAPLDPIVREWPRPTSYLAPQHKTKIYVYQPFEDDAFNGGYLKLEQVGVMPGTAPEQVYIPVGVGPFVYDTGPLQPTLDNTTVRLQNFSVGPFTMPDGSSRPAVTGNSIRWKAALYSTEVDGVLPGGISLLSQSGSGSSNLGVKVDPLQLPRKLPQWISRRGSDASPWNLSNSRGWRAVENTANCYIVNGPGTYAIPVVYGNAIKDGQPNPASYGRKANGSPADYGSNAPGNTFRNAKDEHIDGPWLATANEGSCKPDGAKIVWQDVEGMVSAPALRIIGDRQFLVFGVNTSAMREGNAVVAATLGSKIVWSWHIWVTDYDPYGPEGTERVQNRISPNTELDFMTENLGWCDDEDYLSQENINMRVIEETTGCCFFLPVRFIDRWGNSCYYQFGRKDPFPGALYHNAIWQDKPVYDGIFEKSNLSEVPISTAISNPNVLYTYKADIGWCAKRDVLNFWSATNNSQTVNTDRVVKTVYDPSPVGFVVPPSGAFTGYTKSGEASSNEDEWNIVVGLYEYNSSRWCNFRCRVIPPLAGSVVWYPLLGERNYYTGMPGFAGRIEGNYWSSERSGLFFNSKQVDPQRFNSATGRSCPIRPVREF